ncbi:hypothetical protein PR048_031903 [Dryococelus australis]|uniref:PiggyBac transposable element-derived protein domain-containing protein n=1 Tax=Dryococelus australis TaxID=614101 RepID=A0ABQ9GAK9_9NEOP|nr:hypothetical protein PR048_031903 [Dryococelus australis]
MLCDESSYNLKFEVYTGKTLRATQIGLAAKVVQTLMSGLEGCHHIVFMRNYFSSCDLFSNLKKDNRAMNLILTCHDPSDVSSVNRKMKDGIITTIKCPQVLKDYNSHMNFVNNFDKLKLDYVTNRKSNKWWLLFLHFIDCCVTNAFIMHKNNSQTNIFVRRFKYKGLLAPRIVVMIATTSSESQGNSKSPIAIKTHKPFVDRIIHHESSKHQPVHSKSRRCAVCSSRKNLVCTVWMCTSLDDEDGGEDDIISSTPPPSLPEILEELLQSDDFNNIDLLPDDTVFEENIGKQLNAIVGMETETSPIKLLTQPSEMKENNTQAPIVGLIGNDDNMVTRPPSDYAAASENQITDSNFLENRSSRTSINIEEVDVYRLLKTRRDRKEFNTELLIQSAETHPKQYSRFNLEYQED